MKRILFILALLAPSLSYAQSVRDMMGLGMSAPLSNYINQNMIGTDASGNLSLMVNGTPKAIVRANGLGGATFGAIMTPATSLTPVAADVLSQGLSLMATASPTLAYVELPVATANAGIPFEVYNKGASPLLISPKGIAAATDSINATGAATPYSCATTKLCKCKVLTSSSYVCVAM